MCAIVNRMRLPTFCCCVFDANKSSCDLIYLKNWNRQKKCLAKLTLNRHSIVRCLKRVEPSCPFRFTFSCIAMAIKSRKIHRHTTLFCSTVADTVRRGCETSHSAVPICRRESGFNPKIYFSHLFIRLLFFRATKYM